MTRNQKDIQNLSDAQLVTLVKGDIDMYRYLVERYEKKLGYYIKRLLFVNAEDTEDILQEIFIKVYVNINSYEEKYKFSNWIYRIAHNEAVSFLRSKKYRQKKQNLSASEEDIFDRLPSDVDIEEDFLASSDRMELRSALNSMDAKYREVILLRYFEEKDYNEISEILRISPGTVASLISRAKGKLKILLKNYDQNSR